MKRSGFATSMMAAHLLSFISGMQAAVGLALFTTLLTIENMSSLGVSLLVVSAFLFLLAGTFSVILLWTMSAVRRKGDLARFTLLTPEEVMEAELSERVWFFGLRPRRRHALSIVLAVDGLLTVAGMFLGVGSKLLWS